jgi:hypothetical protein
MNDDDEERFPRITLPQLLAGIFGPILEFWLYGCPYWLSDLFGFDRTTEKTKRARQEDKPRS